MQKSKWLPYQPMAFDLVALASNGPIEMLVKYEDVFFSGFFFNQKGGR